MSEKIQLKVMSPFFVINGNTFKKNEVIELTDDRSKWSTGLIEALRRGSVVPIVPGELPLTAQVDLSAVKSAPIPAQKEKPVKVELTPEPVEEPAQVMPEMPEPVAEFQADEPKSTAPKRKK